jgi:hypothetical protein
MMNLLFRLRERPRIAGGSESAGTGRTYAQSRFMAAA